jgi:hypothetical protein
MCGQLKRTRVVLDTLGELSLLRRRGVRARAGELRLGRAVGAGSQGERPERLVAEEGAAPGAAQRSRGAERLVARACRFPPGRGACRFPPRRGACRVRASWGKRRAQEAAARLDVPAQLLRDRAQLCCEAPQLVRRVRRRAHPPRARI